MARKRYSHQRELIYRSVCGTTEHPTAEMVYRWLKPDHPKLSLGTVYRNLNLLADEGIIVRMPLNVERYDANVRPHAHFCCRACGCVSDLDWPMDQEACARLAAATGMEVTHQDQIFYGRCRACVEAERGTECDCAPCAD